MSTGPRSVEGKLKSRANSVKHGLCCEVIVPEDGAAIQGRISDWFWTLKPQNEFDAWLVEKISVYSLRIDRAERMERRLRDRKSLGAELAWGDDLRLDAEILGGKIGIRPAQVVEELRGSPSGCDWLMSRWSMLAHASDSKPWTPDQLTMAFNLLGTPFEFREGQRPGDILDFNGRVIESGENQPELARREIAELLRRRELVASLDEVDQALTQADLFDESHPELKNLRRYEGTMHNRFRWALSELRYVSPHFKPSPEMIERMVANPNPQPVVEEPAPARAPLALSPAPAPEPIKPKVGRVLEPWNIDCPHPPFMIEAAEVPEDGSKPNLFKILLNRQEKREKKADNRREARRRKAELLRTG
jgi:hypothetical protein